jgi:hypothetical protein
VLVTLVIVVIALGSFAVYQQMRISSLSSAVAKQSSEIYHPSASLNISQFSVTKENASTEPEMYIVVEDNGTLPAESGSLLVMVYGANNSINSCYDGTQNPFPLGSNDTVGLLARLTCGELGDTVVLTLQVDFVSNTGGMTKVYAEKSTISQSQAIKVQTVTVKQVGIRTYVIPQIGPLPGTNYVWSFALRNDAETSISAVNATLSWQGKTLAQISGCSIFGGSNIYGVNTQTPLPPRTTCSTDQNLNGSQFDVGQYFDVSISVTYTNGTSSIVSLTAVVEPPYATPG